MRLFHSIFELSPKSQALPTPGVTFMRTGRQKRVPAAHEEFTSKTHDCPHQLFLTVSGQKHTPYRDVEPLYCSAFLNLHLWFS